MGYYAAILACSLFLAMLVSFCAQKRFHSAADLFGEIRLILPVDLDIMRQLFDPAEEWNLRARNRPEEFRRIQRNRRKLAIRYASHMFHDAHIMQRIGYAGQLSYKREEIIKGKLLVDAGVPVRVRAIVLLVFLRFQQLTYTSANLSCLRYMVTPLLPDWDELVYGAASLSRLIDPRLHSELMRLLTPPAGHVPQ